MDTRNEKTRAGAVKRSISMPVILFTLAEDKQRRLGYSTFSQYLQKLVRQDTLQQ